jgi:hypothetical protein
MSSKSESIQPPKVVVATSGATLPGITGRTPQVPEDARGPDEITFRPVGEQERDAPEVARELDGATAYREDFSVHAPDRAALSAQLARAAALSVEAANAEAWSKYLATERDRAWQQALSSMSELQTHFDAADASSPNIARRYPRTHAFFAVRAKASARAAVTRRKNASKKTDPTPG